MTANVRPLEAIAPSYASFLALAEGSQVRWDTRMRHAIMGEALVLIDGLKW